ncbi:AAA family ATPase [Candidatus Dojkabacteria bacterium]|jgi:MoxR-like ATPase|nr:AAA family ATPase [Candidatus Dojkabacteria bacterium]
MDNTRAVLVKKYLQHMRQFHSGAVSKGNMLVSPPGVGKSQFVAALASLLGIELVTIEAPHIVEEKLINIPFLVKKPTSNTQQQGSTKVQVTKGTAQDEFDIELADSHLFTQLINAQAIPDAQYIQNVYNNANIAALYESMGGTREQIPQLIKDIRSKYRVILFLDEFFRVPSPTIAAILRSLLNKRLGMHQLPNYAYLTYASNLTDTGDSIAKRQQNQRFNMYHLNAASKEDWFAWLLAKFNNDASGVKLNMNIINKFGKILEDADISSDFETTSGDIVRASPRRWEQLILYINSAFPIKDEQDAKSLITNVQINFLHYLDSEYHPIAKKVLKAVVELIKEVSGITVKESDVNSDTDWRHTLKHQVEMKQILGDSRSYIPVVSGPPGIGKTSNVAAVAQEMNLRLVVIDASELVDPGEVIGLPAPDTKEGRRSVKFVASKLFKQINDIIDHEDQRYKTNLIAKLGQDAGSQAYAKYEKSRWKYLIFFDELNRAPPQVMNALRRVILEKNFGEKDNMGVEMKLPKEAIVMGAINPTGEGTHELTHHMRDVMDIIPASASWARQKQFLESKDIEGTSPEVRNAIIQAFELISSHFSLKSLDNDKKPFYLDVGGGEGLYITPNDMTDMYAAASDSVQSVIDDKLREYNADRVTDLAASEIKQLDRDIKENIYDSFEPSLYDIFHNHDLDGTRWLQAFHTWMLNSNVGEQLTKASSSKLTSRGDIKSILEQHLGGTATKPLKDDSRFVNYVKSKDHVSVAHEIDAALSAMVKVPDDAKKLIATPSVKQVEYNAENEEFTTTDTKVPPMFNLLTNVGVALSVNGFSGEVFEHIVGNMDELMDKTLSGLLKTNPPLITKEQYTVLYDEGYDIILKLQELA